MNNISFYVNNLSGGIASIEFKDFSKIIDSMITGLNGRPLKIDISEEIYTDTETIYLPEKISTLNSKEENFNLIKASSIHLWAQTYFGTWRIKDKDFEKFDNKENALKIYHILETIRLDEKIKRELPGIGRILEKLNPKSKISSISDNFKKALNILSNNNATHKDSLELIDSVIKDVSKVSLSQYAGTLKPEYVFLVSKKRIDEDKKNFEKALEELHEKWKEVENKSNNLNKKEDQEENTAKKTFSVQKNENKSNDLILEFGDKNITPPDDIKKIMESIIQDFGDIPEEYLKPSGQNSYNMNANTEKLLNTNIDSNFNFLYNEWDYSKQKYKKNWCTLNVKNVSDIDNNFVNETLSKHRGLIKNLKKTFEALRHDDRKLKRQNNGDDIDFDAFIDACIDIKLGREVDEKLFTKLNKIERNVAVMLMVDMSGSTSGWINKMEKESLVLLCESLEILKDKYAIYGFSGKTRDNCDIYKIKDFNDNYDKLVKNKISNIQAMDYTRMGVHIRHLTMLLNNIEAKTKLLITLSDGKPDDSDGYRGAYGIEDTKRALIETRFQGIHTYCVTIDEDGMDYLPYMYGKTNFSVIKDINKLPIKISEIYRRITT